MSPSIIFWLDTLVSLATSLVALALFFLVLGVNPRRRLNQVLGSFLASSSAFCIIMLLRFPRDAGSM